VRVPDLRAFRSAVRAISADAAGRSTLSTLSTLSLGAPLIVVSTESAARQMRAADSDAQAVTRDELYDRFHARLPHPPRRLTAIERDVIAHASARTASAATDFHRRLRPGLVAEMLRFYDQLRRQSQSVKRFEELISDALGTDDIDRGAQRMRRQTLFLACAFREYERRVGGSGGCDEHMLRDRLLAESSPDPIRRIVVTVADWIADSNGLFVADFDLLARIPGLEAIDIIATEALLGSGFHERLHSWWPGIEEVEGAPSPATGPSRPVLRVPQGAPEGERWWTHRDREEELIAVARQLKADARTGEAVPLDRAAVVFKQPLPYLYLARSVFGGAGIPYRTFDALPLAAEPTTATVDLVLETVSSNFTRAALVALLRSPHFAFAAGGQTLSRQALGAFDRALSDARYLGDASRLEALAAERAKGGDAPAFGVALEVARELAPLAGTATASAHVRCLASFWRGHLRLIDAATAEPGLAARELRARAAIGETLEALAAVHAAHDDPDWTIEDLSLAVRRWIEDQTFEVDPGDRGLHLLDDNAARYGDFDDVAVVGLIDSDWPERPRRNIFYPAALLKSLGWPSEKDRRAAADAHFLDLLAAARRRTTLSIFTLEDDALATRSLQLDEIPRAKLSSVSSPPLPASRIFEDESLSLEPVSFAPLDAGTREWAHLRASRTATDSAQFHGSIDATAARAWSVSALETYLGCPFRFFAQHVLKLEEEPDDEEVMDPRRQGQLVHEVFEKFFSAWQGAGHRAITSSNLDEARRMFTAVVDEALRGLPEAEAGLERTRLLGSPAAAGLGEAVIRMEAERLTPVVERLLEYELKGEFEFATEAGPRTVAIRGKADRLDLLADGTFRLVDYKLGWPPDRRKALQLPIYGLCSEQRLTEHRGRRWTMGEAVYLAFKGPRRVVPLFQNDADRGKVLSEAQARLVAAIDAIAAGQFPPTPDDVYRCETCSFSAVCRKDYVGDV
jgi:RecB family exonuclease